MIGSVSPKLRSRADRASGRGVSRCELDQDPSVPHLQRTEDSRGPAVVRNLLRLIVVEKETVTRVVSVCQQRETFDFLEYDDFMSIFRRFIQTHPPLVVGPREA